MDDDISQAATSINESTSTSRKRKAVSQHASGGPPRSKVLLTAQRVHCAQQRSGPKKKFPTKAPYARPRGLKSKAKGNQFGLSEYVLEKDHPHSNPEYEPGAEASSASAGDHGDAQQQQPLRPSVLVRKTAKAAHVLLKQHNAVFLRDPNLARTLNRKRVKNAIRDMNHTRRKDWLIEQFAHEPATQKNLRTLIEIGKIKTEHIPDQITVPWDILSLPENVRSLIWESSVIDTRFLVIPETPTGKEQPDLAMTCCQIRGEVLPIFYSKSVFAFPLSKEQRGRGLDRYRRMMAVVGGVAGRRWAMALEEKGWLKFVRRVVFTVRVDVEEESEGSEEDDEEKIIRDVVVDVQIRSEEEEGHWRVDGGVHCKAMCVLNGGLECPRQDIPWWLRGELKKLVDPEAGGIRADRLLPLIEFLGRTLKDLGSIRCDESSNSKNESHKP